MGDKKRFTSGRKLDHLRICVGQEVEAGWAGFSDVRLVHSALPECDMDRIDRGTRFLGHGFSFPLFIAAMTGGHPETAEVNRRLARAAERYGIGMGVGSQRAALENSDLENTFSVVRDEAPRAFLVANLGAVQLRDHGAEWAERAVAMIDADAIAIHLNFLQEAIQPEGDHDATGCLAAIQELAGAFRVPVIVKETGSGISAGTARRCWGVGCGAIDIGGWGGTNWAAIESIRADETKKAEHRGLIDLGARFADWGIPTVVSLCEVARTGGPVIATGGVRSGLDIAKAVALGADLAGMALPLLAPALESEDALFGTIARIEQELRVAMFLTGSPNLAALRKARVFISGRTREMIEQHAGGAGNAAAFR
jgi:isopentenyl-diphosphate delta-isomerase